MDLFPLAAGAGTPCKRITSAVLANTDIIAER
jgi:hypothetical protein